jgi:hypothetical protein
MCGIIPDNIEQAIQKFGGLLLTVVGVNRGQGRSSPERLPSGNQFFNVEYGVHFSLQ